MAHDFSSESNPLAAGLGIGGLGIAQRGRGVGMTGLRLHILQGRPVVQRQGDVRAPQIMRGQVANPRACAAETEQAHNGLRAHRRIRFEFGIAPGGHGREEAVVGASLGLP